ncbi:hypothetical protein [Streptomyces sp. NPDC048584]|uniref:hypothetical protein n=1 Tax=Streptomyces sp. NPDC048584 TaxID=3365573 RepID=UPI00371B62C3
MDDNAEQGGTPVEDDVYDEENPDVFLDVPLLKVDEIDLDVENLRAHVSLQTEVLDLLRLSVGADVTLGRVHLGISGVEAQAQLRVRLDNVAAIVNRVLTTLDRNPEILRDLARGVGSAVQDVGGGARQAVGELGTGAGRAVQDVGQGAGAAVQDVGQGAGTAVRDVGQGAGAAVQDVGQGAGTAVQDVGQGAGTAVRDVGQGAGTAVQDVGQGAGRAVHDVGQTTEAAVGDVGRGVGSVAEGAGGEAGRVVGDAGGEAGRVVGDAGGEAGRAVEDAGGDASRAAAADVTGDAVAPAEPAARSPRGPAEGEDGNRTARRESATRRRRVRSEDGKLPPKPARRRVSGERDEPP